MTPVVEVAMEPKRVEAVAVVDPIMALIERASKDAAVDVDKMERLMLMHERHMARLAEDGFNAAMNLAQTDMRPVAADATNPQTRSKYATYAKLDGALRPLYTKHGFGLSFDTGEGALSGHVRVVCYVTHQGGHTRHYHVDIPADGKGARGGDVMTATHAVGAGLSYGMRYLLKMIFNVAVGEDDRDGNEPKQVTDPEGFADWSADFEIVAREQGLDALKSAWKKSDPKFRDHMEKHYRGKLAHLKAVAEKVKA